MEKRQIIEDYYYVKTRDRIGGTLRTDIFKLDSGIFRAYSFYAQDEDEAIVGIGESDNEEKAVKLSRKDLRREWKVEHVMS